ncbi:MAG TPA: beta-N-acetylhexosaminidase [Polyangiaceae bacterium]|jgi:beta-N-acetylhexosaminidase|nr:beta-N-acetylhexosaminidase [Polyangiaceae bacterium]
MASDLETQAARLFTVGFYGKTITPELEQLIRRGVGGAIFFARNVGTPAEVAEVTSAIKRLAGRPLFCALDQEGGQVSRLRQGFTEVPPMRALGISGSAKLAREVGELIGRELRAVGFDMNYAPVLDVDTNPANPIIAARSFARTPDVVSELGVALAAGLESAGVAACGKHFPGHGDTSQDSHLELPRLPHSLARLEEVELRPFAAAVKAGIPSMMTAHVIFEPLDPVYPATMSRPVLHGILREKMGYDGLIVTDDIEMRAIADHYGIEETVVRGINAGVDHFLCCHTADVAHRAIDAIIRAVESGAVSRKTLATANRRIERFADRYARPAITKPDLRLLRSEAHLAVIERLLEGMDPEITDVGIDPTEIMERIRLERAGRASA